MADEHLEELVRILGAPTDTTSPHLRHPELRDGVAGEGSEHDECQPPDRAEDDENPSEFTGKTVLGGNAGWARLAEHTEELAQDR